MKIKRFEIRNYRAIEFVEVNLNSALVPIIGVNESGKTSILNAIMALDEFRDKFNNGEHLEFNNNYSTAETKNCTVSAIMTLSKAEIEDLIKATSTSTDSEDFKELKKLNTQTEFKLIRNLESKKYLVENEYLTSKTKDVIAKKLYMLFPYILYFDDFTDRVPSAIEIPEGYETGTPIRRGKDREWKEILVEIFKRSNTDIEESGEDPLSVYLSVTDEDRKADILSDIESALNKEIIEEWKKIKRSGAALADDSDKLTLSISNKGSSFYFKVKDESRKDKKRTFSVNERSKGFQWFFNYMIKLKFNPKYKNDQEKSLFLLDEPGSYLHSAAQSELLKELKRVSQKNTIIYCTHSQYLLNPDIVNLGSIRIASKKKSKVQLFDYGSYKETKYTGALSPVYQALQINYSPEFKGKVVITEGVTDFYLFKTIQKHSKKIPKDIRFIPGSGASQSSTLISFALSFSDSFRLLLDNDTAGRKASHTYVKSFGEPLEKFIHLYNEDKSKFVLEDHLSETDRLNLLSTTNCDSVKRALGFLYYDYTALKQRNFVSNLSQETLSNLDKCFHLFKNM